MIVVFFGGVFGAILRFGLSELIHSNKIATWLVNIIGSFMLVFLVLLYNEMVINDVTFKFWGIGFSGAFTTFSTINHQVFDHLREGNFKQALFTSLSTYLIILICVIFIYHFLTRVYFQAFY